MSKENLDKTESVRFRLTGHEKAAFAEFCDDCGCKQSVVMRRLVREAISHGPTFFDDEQAELKRLRLSLAALGGNLNQIAKKINAGLVKADPLRNAKLDELKSEVGTVTALIKVIVDLSKSRRVRLRAIARKDEK